ncbi:hypothetical protein [Pectobacterium carotovorum]|uniref:hypothetical protein n=1 Tax=Pectobacterium carotovorum TaxID=554 RepID=UPI0038734040
MKGLEAAIELFRKSNSPLFDGEKFSASLPYSPEASNLLKLILDSEGIGGSFNELLVDDEDIYDASSLPSTGGVITYTFNVTQRSADRFYKSKADFIKINSLKKGVLPKDFFIVEDNYSSYDTQKPGYILKIEKICNLIGYLSKIAHFHDIKNDSSGSYYRLVFVLHSESKSSTAVIETNLSEEMIYGEDIDTSLIESLVNIKEDSDAHYIEKMNTFRNTIIEYISKSNNSFTNIVNNWNVISNLYSNNLAVYMSAFSFHKARKEISEAEIDYAEKTSKVVSEISSKALAIPISLVASIAIFQIPTKTESLIAFLGVALTSLITSLVISSQKRQLKRIKHAKETLFSSIDRRLNNEETEKDELKIRFNEAQDSLNKNEAFCKKILDLIFCLSWVPASAGAILLLIKFI